MRFLSFFLAAFLLSTPVWAATTDGPPVAAAPVTRVETAALPDRLTGDMRAITPLVLRSENALVTLWGIRLADDKQGLMQMKALELMDALVQEQRVDCKIMNGAAPRYSGRCATQDSQDLALELVNAGYAFVDRIQTDGSVFAAGYEKAQETARATKNGIWFYDDEQSKNRLLPLWMEPYLAILLPIGLVFGPFLGLLIIALVMRHWLKTMAEEQAQESQRNNVKEERLVNRERQVLIATLEAELLENKNKIEAFLSIYGDMLNDLKSGSKPRYQDSGDIVQKHPNYSKTVFESNVGKFSLLDMTTAGRLSKIYATMSTENEYINIEPGLELDTAVKLIEKVIQDTKELVPDIDAAIAELEAAMSST